MNTSYTITKRKEIRTRILVAFNVHMNGNISFLSSLRLANWIYTTTKMALSSVKCTLFILVKLTSLIVVIKERHLRRDNCQLQTTVQ